jgi:hypothetical protein
MGEIHICAGGQWQPLTQYEDPYIVRIVRTPSHNIYRCHECLDRRQARNLEISVDYDRIRIRCKGGKHPGWL